LSVYFRQEEAGRGKEHSDTHQVVSERDSVCILQTEEARGRQSTGGLCKDLFAGRQQSIDSQQDCKMKLDTLKMQSDSSRSVREADRHSKMATEGRRKKSKAEKLAEMDEELADIRAEIERLELKMRQDKKPRWVYEWPMKKPKMKWPVRELMVIRQRRLLKEWLRYVENLKATEEELVQICEPEIGEILGEENGLGSSDDLKNCQEGREVEIPIFQEGNRLRSLRDLTDCQEDSEGILHCQLGSERRSLRHLEDCQEGSGSISDCQVGRDEHSRLSEGLMDSEVSSIQQGLLMKMGSVDLIVCQESSGSIPYCQVGRDEQMSWNQPRS
jgi:hypothetical protein